MPNSSPKILIIDDDPHIVGVLSVTLEDAKFNVTAAHSGKEGLRAAYDQHPDLVLLDIMMPGMDGFEVLDHLRAVTDIPIIMLTAMGQDQNRIRGMDKGATDFISKGTNMDVLIAHIQNRLRTYERKRTPQGPRRYDGQLEVDVPRRRVRLDDKPVNLTPLQWKLFKYLVENEGRIASYQNLLNAGWDNPEFADPRAVKVQISGLREKLNDDARDSRYIHTIREEGYLFEVRKEPNRL